ncbi:DNA-binding response regulator [Taibaiella sp. KBW10]|uniref:response regulator transcription factor n=1 Tax=Taibaiella sp. KBW10 TaxID=2153357 RepID=UPI000F5ABD4E|nr:response regulator transcription factor [Taibaiella sp. KBW10]RQO32130.1 DNA-binding response regulator [Taibaiella sp. KBW10]
MDNIQVIIVDDHELMSKGISSLVNSIPDYQVIHEARNGKELVHYLSDERTALPDIILLDINMPVMDGFKTMEWMQEHHPEIPVLALTINDDDASVINMLRLGVKGYLLKETDSEELILAMQTILNRGFYSSEIASAKLLNSIIKPKGSIAIKVNLKERELEFLRFACTDMTYIQIADKMCLSPKTVDHYRDVLFEKFDVKSRVGLVIFAIKNRLVKL